MSPGGPGAPSPTGTRHRPSTARDPLRPGDRRRWMPVPVQRRHDHGDVRLLVLAVTADASRVRRITGLSRWPSARRPVTVRANNKCVPVQRERERDKKNTLRAPSLGAHVSLSTVLLKVKLCTGWFVVVPCETPYVCTPNA